MKDLNDNGFFKLENHELKKIRENFLAEKINDSDTLRIIKDFFINYGFILDPHTATAVGASKKFNLESETLILGTAHPYKFLETIKIATSREVKMPNQLSNILNKKEKYDILENNISDVKSYILEKIK